ncbi:leucine-rich repeat protein [Artemisia annua]|uniref:Leucine-rich repeat protein n=1 Tax=Artemisia annua TaxID=35608 RepID=A0A2U1MUR6_ARTAN|nr:leucine-rich repeat protein [Artemisia annua]
MNKLSGHIPRSLSTLHSLSYLNLSFNKLSGAIRVGNQLQTLDDSIIYQGNTELCRPPLTRSCKGNDLSLIQLCVRMKLGQDDREGLGPDFVAGFIGLLCCLNFIRIWRLAYIEIVNNVYGQIKLYIILIESCSAKEKVHFLYGGVQAGQRPKLHQAYAARYKYFAFYNKTCFVTFGPKPVAEMAPVFATMKLMNFLNEPQTSNTSEFTQ